MMTLGDVLADKAARSYIEPQDLVKGDKITLKNGWKADVMGKAKSIRIFLRVYGFATELGDTYTRDIAHRDNPDGSVTRVKVVNQKHLKQFAAISAAGF